VADVVVIPVLERPVITGVPLIIGLVIVLLVRVVVESVRSTVPDVLGNVIVRLAVGSTTLRVVE
jgi:hypothetical protein